MNRSVIFAQQFSRLFYMVQQSQSTDTEVDFAARGTEAVLRGHSATLGVTDWQLQVDGEPLPVALSGVPDLSLAAFLAAHSVHELRFDAFVGSGALLDTARTLASEPAPGDGGARFATQFAARGTPGVHLVSSKPSNESTVGGIPTEIQGLRRRFSTPAGQDFPPPHRSTPSEPQPSAVFGIDMGTQGASTPNFTRSGAPGVLEQLDRAIQSGSLGRVLEDQLRKAEDASRSGDNAAVFEILFAIVSRESAVRAPEHRTPYVVAMKRLARRDLLIALARHLATNRDLEDQILSIFGRLGEEAAIVLVEELAESEQRFERRALFDILSKLKSGHSALRHSLTDHRWFVVRNAAELLGQLRGEGSADELATLLSHEDERVRKAAAVALASFKNDRGVTQPLMRALGDKSTQVRAAAVLGLVDRPSAKALEVLLQTLEKEDDDHVQAVLLEALGKNGTPTAVKRLIEAAEPTALLARKKSTAFRCAATAALRSVDSALARTALESLRKDKDPAVRVAAGGSK